MRRRKRDTFSEVVHKSVYGPTATNSSLALIFMTNVRSQFRPAVTLRFSSSIKNVEKDSNTNLIASKKLSKNTFHEIF